MSASAEAASASAEPLATFAGTTSLLGAEIAFVTLDRLEAEVRRHFMANTAEGIAVSEELASDLPWLRALDCRVEGGASTALSRGIAGVAATGSVLVGGRSQEDRAIRSLARVHLVVLPAESVVPALSDAANVIRAAVRGSGYLTLVSGPSRTADIEKVLTIGAHGPGQVVVIVVLDWNPAA